MSGFVLRCSVLFFVLFSGDGGVAFYEATEVEDFAEFVG